MRNVASVDSILTNLVIRAQLSSAATSFLEDLDVANRNLLCCIEDSLKLDNEARGNIDSMVDPCCNDLRDLKSVHYHKIVEITENVGKCLEKEYMVDEPSCLTPSLNLQVQHLSSFLLFFPIFFLSSRRTRGA